MYEPPPTKIPSAVAAQETELPVEITLTPPPILTLEAMESIAPGDYLIYTYRKGLEIASLSSKNHIFLAPIIDDWATFSPDKQFITYSKPEEQFRMGPLLVYDIKNNREVNLEEYLSEVNIVLLLIGHQMAKN